MTLSPRYRNLLRVGVGITLAFIYIPLLVIAVYAFNGGTTLKWPLDSVTTHWFSDAIHDSAARDAFVTSIKVGLVATGIALSDTFTQVFGVTLGLFTVIVAHATFCIVVVYNNVIARLRRVSENLEEASADLGAHTWQTFRHVTLPTMQTALVAGALLAFALSFDEIIVTNFTIGAGEQTLPVWIFTNLFRPNNLPIVNVVAVLVVLLSIIPVYLAHRLTREESISARGGTPVAESTAIP